MPSNSSRSTTLLAGVVKRSEEIRRIFGDFLHLADGVYVVILYVPEEVTRKAQRKMLVIWKTGALNRALAAAEDAHLWYR